MCIKNIHVLKIYTVCLKITETGNKLTVEKAVLKNATMMGV
jgi:hypothetical protein